jgi:hypothetical protein
MTTQQKRKQCKFAQAKQYIDVGKYSSWTITAITQKFQCIQSYSHYIKYCNLQYKSPQGVAPYAHDTPV